MNNRNTQIKNASIVSTIGNLILAICKIFFGFISGSFAVIGDGIDTATDVITSFIGVITAKTISKKPNQKYVYGYEKAETINTIIIAIIIILAGGQLIYNSIVKLISLNYIVPSISAIYVTIFSIIVKIFLTMYQFKMGHKNNSSLLIANAKNMQNDILISGSVLVSLFFTIIFEIGFIDLVAGIFIGIYILRIGFKIIRESNKELMDALEDKEVYKNLVQVIDKNKKIINPHRIRVRKMGLYYSVSLDVELDGNLTLSKVHELVSNLEENIKKKIHHIYDIRIHPEPIGDHISKEKYGLSEKEIKKWKK